MTKFAIPVKTTQDSTWLWYSSVVRRKFCQRYGRKSILTVQSPITNLYVIGVFESNLLIIYIKTRK